MSSDRSGPDAPHGIVKRVHPGSRSAPVHVAGYRARRWAATASFGDLEVGYGIVGDCFDANHRGQHLTGHTLAELIEQAEAVERGAHEQHHGPVSATLWSADGAPTIDVEAVWLRSDAPGAGYTWHLTWPDGTTGPVDTWTHRRQMLLRRLTEPDRAALRATAANLDRAAAELGDAEASGRTLRDALLDARVTTALVVDVDDQGRRSTTVDGITYVADTTALLVRAVTRAQVRRLGWQWAIAYDARSEHDTATTDTTSTDGGADGDSEDPAARAVAVADLDLHVVGWSSELYRSREDADRVIGARAAYDRALTARDDLLRGFALTAPVPAPATGRQPD